jgi:hypothetical protein
MDTMAQIQDEWRISSKDLRDRVHTQLTLQVMETYSQFFQQFHGVPFSKKNKESYLRYPPPAVENVLNKIFM